MIASDSDNSSSSITVENKSDSYGYDDSNVFARILREELPAKKVYEDDHVLAFHDINPSAPVHILVVPKKPCISYVDFISSSSDEEISKFFRSVHMIAEKCNLHKTGYRLLTNHGKSAGQVVYHFHVHILGY